MSVSPGDRWSLVLFVAVAALAACGGEPRVSPTSPTSEASGVSTRTISGTAWLHSSAGAQPLSGARVGIWLERPGSADPAGATTTDAAGRFSFDTPADALVRLYTGTPELFQPCLSTVAVGKTEAIIRTVAEADLLNARDWPDFAVERQLSGTVVEASAAGTVPSANAWVQVDGVYGDGRPLADTRTDTQGRFVVCGLEGASMHALVVAKAGYRIATTAVPAQDNGSLDVQLNACLPGHTKVAGGWCY